MTDVTALILDDHDAPVPLIVDLVAAAAQNRVLVWQTELPSTGVHTITDRAGLSEERCNWL